MCNRKLSILFIQWQQCIGKHFTLFFSCSLVPLQLKDKVLKQDGWGTLLPHVMGSPWALQPWASDPRLRQVKDKTRRPFRKSWEQARENALTLVVFFCYQTLSSSGLPFKWGKTCACPCMFSFLVKWYTMWKSHLWKKSSDHVFLGRKKISNKWCINTSN